MFCFFTTGVITPFSFSCWNHPVSLRVQSGCLGMMSILLLDDTGHVYRPRTPSISRQFALFLFLMVIFTICLPCHDDIIMSSYQNAEGTLDRKMLDVETFHHFLLHAPKLFLGISFSLERLQMKCSSEVYLFQ